MARKPDRNQPCHCGSGKKYKNCCQSSDTKPLSSKMGIVGLVAAILLGLLIAGLALSGGEGPRSCPQGMVWSEAHGHCH